LQQQAWPHVPKGRGTKIVLLHTCPCLLKRMMNLWRVRMYLHMHVHRYVHMHVHRYVHMNVHRYVHMNVHRYVHRYVHMHVHRYVYMYICMCIGMYICAYSWQSFDTSFQLEYGSTYLIVDASQEIVVILQIHHFLNQKHFSCKQALIVPSHSLNSWCIKDIKLLVQNPFVYIDH
jgi:hypothetical protein